MLVVDDNQDAADSLAQLLRLSGHQVDVAYTGMSALARVRSCRPDVVLCDLGLPELSGYDFAKAVRCEHADSDPARGDQRLRAARRHPPIAGGGLRRPRRQARAGCRHRALAQLTTHRAQCAVQVKFGISVIGVPTWIVISRCESNSMSFQSPVAWVTTPLLSVT